MLLAAAVKPVGCAIEVALYLAAVCLACSVEGAVSECVGFFNAAITSV